MSQTNPLLPLRTKIDELDEQILAILNRRASIVREIGQIKADQHTDFYTPARETAIYERLERLNQGPFPNESIRSVFREIFSASLSMEAPMTVVYLGPHATFTHLACVQRFGFSVTGIPAHSIKDVFDEVERDRADFGVVPVENSTEGVVNSTLDLFTDSTLKIYGEIIVKVSHHLLSKTGKMEGIERICSHPHALAQCKKFVQEQVPNIPIIEVESTARAAAMAQNDPTVCAIASDLAARLYHLIIIKKAIEDYPNNATRFLIIAKKCLAPTGHDKTSLLFSMPDRVGALYDVMRVFSEHTINLTKIESRPSKKKAWEYLFYVDMAGHMDDVKITQAIEKLRQQNVFIKVLGSYPISDNLKN